VRRRLLSILTAKNRLPHQADSPLEEDGSELTVPLGIGALRAGRSCGQRVLGDVRADRRELLRVLDRLTFGDVVTVTRTALRTAPSTCSASSGTSWTPFRSLAGPWADTGTSSGRLMLAVLGGLADVERNYIRTRTDPTLQMCATSGNDRNGA
jgi:hypothetical protein